MNLTTSTRPVRHFIVDGFVSPEPDWTVPPADAVDTWEVRYASDVENGKRTMRTLPGWATGVLQRMYAADVLQACSNLFGVTASPDVLLWGGGLQVMQPGSFLGVHLDAALSAKRPSLRRAVQMVCFCHWEWRPEWGGQFLFTNPAGEVVERIEPLPGRLLAFDNCDLAYHGVAPIAPDAPERITLAASLLANARVSDTRTRALFLPNRR